MSNYSATIEFFSSLCQNQLNQPLSRLDAANDALGATLVPCPLLFRALTRVSSPCSLST
jgi:hypothetical protein